MTMSSTSNATKSSSSTTTNNNTTTKQQVDQQNMIMINYEMLEYEMKMNASTNKRRQIQQQEMSGIRIVCYLFIHNGYGFVFHISGLKDIFDDEEKQYYDEIFKSIELFN